MKDKDKAQVKQSERVNADRVSMICKKNVCYIARKNTEYKRVTKNLKVVFKEFVSIINIFGFKVKAFDWWS